MTRRIDLDHNATTRLDARVRAAMLQVLDDAHGNPSSVHEEGRRARELVEQARGHVAALVGGAAGELSFTSGGTESDVWGIVGAARAARAAGRPARVVSSPVEHPAVRGALDVLRAEGFAVQVVAVDGRGRIDPDEVERACGGAALASFALANHELGNLYPVASYAAGARRAGALFHCDAVQGAGKIAIDVAALGVDLLSISAHKLHGPKGVGALWVRRGVTVAPLLVGGHQERGMRAGTENVSGVVGFGEAARLARGEWLAEAPRIAELRDRLEQGALAAIAGGRVNGDPERRVANTSNLAFDGAAGELVVIGLDLEGVASSTGAACTSGSVEPSPVLLALGQSRERAAEGVRFSLGRDVRAEDVDRVLALLSAIVVRVRKAQ